MIVDREIEMQKYINQCLIDYTKAFDKIQHENLFELLGKLNLF